MLPPQYFTKPGNTGKRYDLEDNHENEQKEKREMQASNQHQHTTRELQNKVKELEMQKFGLTKRTKFIQELTEKKITYFNISYMKFTLIVDDKAILQIGDAFEKSDKDNAIIKRK
ncbi:9811_t:CDS:2 [Entrophospora sp. SA101]|nr:9811_t:CDS:2 [Entrophospora sp. SA101]